MQGLGEILSKIESIRQKAKERQPVELPAAVSSASVPVPVQLPAWPEPVRAVPNGLLRSALFGVVQKGRRRYIKGEQIAALDGIEIRYTGERLDQGDLDVWESVLHAVRLQELGSQCRVTSYALLKLMGKTDTGGMRDVLHMRLMRLKATAVEIRCGKYMYAGSLIDEVYQDTETREYVVVVNPKLRALYESSQYTQIEWAVRQALAGHQLAQWLHGFYSTHAAPFPYKVETLRQLCGSEAKLLSDFRKDLRAALKKMQEATGWQWEIDDADLVHVDKRPTGSQARHIARRMLNVSKA